MENNKPSIPLIKVSSNENIKSPSKVLSPSQSGFFDKSYFDNQVVEFQKEAIVGDMLMPDVSNILVIYTGGTIGMSHHPERGYEPVANYLATTLSTQSRFHDPNGARELSSRPQSRVGSVMGLDKLGKKFSMGDDEGEIIKNELEKEEKEDNLTWLLTPISLYGKRIRYAIKEYDPLLDSCNMTMSDWIKIACDIENNYQRYDAFIVLHGTDTMAYTASALSFMLENLGKTVIITGSQVPISEVRNDAIENLLGALTVAGHFVIPEVSLYFGNELYRGNRSSKVSAIDFDAFDSPNLRSLVQVGVNIEVNWVEILTPLIISKFSVQKRMNPNVASLRLFPGITEATITHFLAHPIQGVVLETYGAGNAPDRKDLLKALKQASDRGVVIVNCTQCIKGKVSDKYATAKGLAYAEVVPGSDMTQECALTKLSYLLAQDLPPSRVRALMRLNLRGELTGPLYIPEPNLPINPTIDPNTLLQQITRKLVSLNINPAIKINGIESRDGSDRLILPILICTASASDDVGCLQYLKDSKGEAFNVNCIDYDGRTPIHIASCQGHLSTLTFLMRSGGSVHSLDRSGHTALYYACYYQHIPIIESLVGNGAHFNKSEMKAIAAVFLMFAGSGQHTRLVPFLKAGMDVNISLSDKRTALHLACDNLHLNTVKFLLNQPRIDPILKDRNQHTPLQSIMHTTSSHHINRQTILDLLITALEEEH